MTRIVLVTEHSSPSHCGIGDYTLHLAQSLNSANCEAIIFALEGECNESAFDARDAFSSVDSKFCRLEERITKCNPALVILQLTPLMYGAQRYKNRHSLQTFWIRICLKWRTAIILHETYFKVWWHPVTWLKGEVQRRHMHAMIRTSDYIFTASEPLIDELKERWPLKKIEFLPIGSNFPKSDIRKADARKRLNISDDEISIILFGGGNNLKWMARLVDLVDSHLVSSAVKVRWFLMGGAQVKWFKLKAPALQIGRIDPDDVSVYLSSADIFLVPHYSGLNAKRGTVMAALQHGLPIVGTNGAMTDNFWAIVPGVRLIERRRHKEFAAEVCALAKSNDLRREFCMANLLAYSVKFDWPVVADKLSSTLDFT